MRNNQYNNFYDNQYNESIILKSLKLWLYASIILTIGYLLCTILLDNTFSIDTMSDSQRQYIRSITPAYPPPLVNFMDPVDVFKMKP